MAANSKIEWTDRTWNPIAGCSKVSPGCDNCYAITAAHRLAGNPNPKIYRVYEGTTAIVNSRANWTGLVRLVPERLDEPLRWRKPQRVFVNSMSDLFHESLPAEEIQAVVGAMLSFPQHTFQCLTKRSADRVSNILYGPPKFLLGEDDVAEHVWLGVSVENQAWADRRLPTTKRLADSGWLVWVSYEPALGPLDLSAYPWVRWVVAGGESGLNAESAHPDWFRRVRDWCESQDIPFFFKQWGEWLPAGQCSSDGLVYTPDAVKIGKKMAGHILDGKVHQQFPVLDSIDERRTERC